MSLYAHQEDRKKTKSWNFGRAKVFIHLQVCLEKSKKRYLTIAWSAELRSAELFLLMDACQHLTEGAVMRFGAEHGEILSLTVMYWNMS